MRFLVAGAGGVGLEAEFGFEVEAGAENGDGSRSPGRPAGRAAGSVEEPGWFAAAAAWRADERVTLRDMSKYVATGHLMQQSTV